MRRRMQERQTELTQGQNGHINRLRVTFNKLQELEDDWMPRYGRAIKYIHHKSSDSQAQAFYEYGLDQVGYDAHRLDRDYDGITCEALPFVPMVSKLGRK